MNASPGFNVERKDMTFSCKNHDFDTDMCKKLKAECIMGRPGCVLEGKVSLSEDIINRLNELEKESKTRKRRKGISRNG